jgi:hypothetical protein
LSIQYHGRAFGKRRWAREDVASGNTHNCHDAKEAVTWMAKSSSVCMFWHFSLPSSDDEMTVAAKIELFAPKKIEIGATFPHSPTTSPDWQGTITHLSYGAT